MSKFKLLTIILLSQLAIKASAQKEKPVNSSSFNLEEARKYAVQNSYNVQTAQKDYDISREQYKQYLSIGLPQINGSVGYNYNVDPVKSLLPGEFFGQPGTFQQVSFTPWYQLSTGITASTTLIDGSYFTGVQAAKSFKELSQNQKEKSVLQVREDVSKAYYTVLLLDESSKVIDSTLNTLKKLLFETEQYQKNGFREIIDVEQVKLNVDMTENLLNKTKMQKNLAENALKLQMGFPVNNEIVLTDNLKSLNADLPVDYIINSSENGYDSKSNIDMRILDKLYTVNKQNQSVELSKSFPSLGMFLNWNYNGFSNDRSKPVLFSSGSQYYKAGTILGFSLHVPIFSSLGRWSSFQKAKIQTEKVKIQQTQADEGLKLAYLNARNNYLNSLKTLETDKSNLELAQRIRTVNRIKFKEGLIASFELTNSENQYFSAVSSYLQTVYNLLNYKLEFDKLTNKL